MGTQRDRACNILFRLRANVQLIELRSAMQNYDLEAGIGGLALRLGKLGS